MKRTRSKSAGESVFGDYFTGPAQVVADMHHSMVTAVPTPITRSTGAVFDFGALSPEWFAELIPGWRLVSVDDTMARIGPASAGASRFFNLFGRGMLYGVVTIERDHRDQPPSMPKADA